MSVVSDVKDVVTEVTNPILGGVSHNGAILNQYVITPIEQTIVPAVNAMRPAISFLTSEVGELKSDVEALKKALASASSLIDVKPLIDIYNDMTNKTAPADVVVFRNDLLQSLNALLSEAEILVQNIGMEMPASIHAQITTAHTLLSNPTLDELLRPVLAMAPAKTLSGDIDQGTGILKQINQQLAQLKAFRNQGTASTGQAPTSLTQNPLFLAAMAAGVGVFSGVGYACQWLASSAPITVDVDGSAGISVGVDVEGTVGSEVLSISETTLGGIGKVAFWLSTLCQYSIQLAVQGAEAG